MLAQAHIELLRDPDVDQGSIGGEESVERGGSVLLRLGPQVLGRLITVSRPSGVLGLAILVGGVDTIMGRRRLEVIRTPDAPPVARTSAGFARLHPADDTLGDMALEKKYDETPLQVLTDKVTRARIRRGNKATGRSQAQIVREILEVGLPMWEEMNGVGEVDDLGD